MTRFLLLLVMLCLVSSAQRISRVDYLAENPAPKDFRGPVWIPADEVSFVVTTTNSPDLARDRQKKRAFELPAQAIDGRIAVYMTLKAGESKVISVHTGPSDRIARLKAAYPAVCDSRLLGRGGEAVWESDRVAYALRGDRIEALGKHSARSVLAQPMVRLARFDLPPGVRDPEVIAAGPVAAAVRAGGATFVLGRNERWTHVELPRSQTVAVSLPERGGETRLQGDRWIATLAGSPAVGLALYAAPEHFAGSGGGRAIRLRPGKDGRVRYAFAAYWAEEHRENVVEQGESDVRLPQVPGMDREATSGRILLRPSRMDTAAAFEERLRGDLAHLEKPPRVTRLPAEPAATAPRPKSYDEALDLMLHRIRALTSRNEGKFWFSSDAKGAPGFVSPNRSWGDGYLVSMLWDGYNTLRDGWYRNAALDANRRMLGGEESELHITGLNFWNASVRSYRETGDAVWRESGLKCADMMVRIADPVTGLIPEYGPAVRRRPDDPYDQNNYVKIDALVGLPILWWAYGETRDKRYLDAASRHMTATMNTLVEPDGAALQMLWLDPRTGGILGIATNQGYGGNSRWARALSWVLDGIPDAYRATKDENYRAQFERSARWFEDNLPEDLISWYDFDDQAVFWRYRDSSTSAISAYGLLRMSELEPDRTLADRYRTLGMRVVNALIDRCLTPVGSADSRPPGMLAEATYTKPNEGEFIWGNYSLVRSLCWLKGKGLRR